ncbi:type 1 periplasmic binding fold superfamily protein [Maribacter sp. 1_MG-2023]|uniref:type 1 periplasmic binding fold superfamily protein n=1 Tax=Maribacter sp. 1_MG-2023 TaxID=3062677 RepID=UPI0026E43AD8|nr:type 1 periplasmic binding fold superfamily protein [Maribacter sp. 1_MG-2023]MDO6473194.1 type 1 periplasmic binding fold superfamily protein [Maribacter sp. 1_MG-2023]
MKRNKTLKTVLALSLMATVMTSCSSDDDTPEIINEEEIITTLTVTLTSANGTATLQSQDLDGDGPNAPVITADNLTANTTYTGSIELLNETESPAEDITEEVEEEADEHQFFFSLNGSLTDVTYSDEDGDGNPIGLEFELTTGDAGSGSITITLRHEPTKPNDGTLADAGGETDIAQTFTVVVE